MLQKVERVDPNLSESFKPGDQSSSAVIDLFFHVKTASWDLFPKGKLPKKSKKKKRKKAKGHSGFQVSDDLRQHLIENAPRAFDVSQLNDRDLLLYYSNSLRGLSAVLEAQIQKRFVNQLLEGYDNPSIRPLVLRAFDVANSPGLAKKKVSPTDAKDILENTLHVLPWPQLLEFFSSHLHFYGRELSKSTFEIIEGKAKKAGFNKTMRKLIVASYKKPRSKPKYCCMDKKGCKTCPNNRRFRLPAK